MEKISKFKSVKEFCESVKMIKLFIGLTVIILSNLTIQTNFVIDTTFIVRVQNCA